VLWTVAAVVIVTVLWLLIRSAKYRASVPYDPRSDYQYTLAGEVLPVAKVEQERLVLSPCQEGSLVVAVIVSPTSLGRFFQPWVEVAQGGKTTRAAFERGVDGLRYLDLTELLPLSGNPLELTCHYCRIEDQQCSAVRFDRPQLAKVVAIAPHPDDCEIACFGLTRSKPEHFLWVHVTPGDNTLRYEGAADTDKGASELAARIRSYDALVCGTWAGVAPSRCLSLGYFDSKLQEMFEVAPNPVVSRYGLSEPIEFRSPSVQRDRPISGATWPSLTADLRFLIEKHGATVVVTPHPLLDSHADHVYTTLALLEAVLQPPSLPVELLLYVGHHRLTESWPFGEAATNCGMFPALQDDGIAYGVYSHPIDAETQTDKVVALDNQHALREPPLPWRSGESWRWVRDLARRWLLGSHQYDHNYYRRAVRSNELFLVVGSDQLLSLRSALIKRLTS
jgi:LmbE family N-acetylglucosaminyl deacetylase